MALDLDIVGFRVTKRVSLSKVKPVEIKVVVKNNSDITGDGVVTVVGTQNGADVITMTMPVSDPVGNGRTTVDFDPYLPIAVGNIEWTATMDDGDGALDPGDEAMATTRVVD